MNSAGSTVEIAFSTYKVGWVKVKDSWQALLEPVEPVYELSAYQQFLNDWRAFWERIPLHWVMFSGDAFDVVESAMDSPHFEQELIRTELEYRKKDDQRGKTSNH